MSDSNNTYAKIFSQHVNSIYRFVYLSVQNKEVTEDIVSETFKRMLEQQDLHPATAKNWLLTVARNIMFNRFKSKKEQPKGDIQDYENTTAEEHDYEYELLTEELIVDLKNKLEELTVEMRQVISLKIWDDKSFPEIAEILGENENTVKYRFYEGLNKIRRSIVDFDKKKATLGLVIAGIALLPTNKVYAASASFVAGFKLVPVSPPNNVSIINQLTKVFSPKVWIIPLVAISVILLIILSRSSSQAPASTPVLPPDECTKNYNIYPSNTLELYIDYDSCVWEDVHHLEEFNDEFISASGKINVNTFPSRIGPERRAYFRCDGIDYIELTNGISRIQLAEQNTYEFGTVLPEDSENGKVCYDEAFVNDKSGKGIGVIRIGYTGSRPEEADAFVLGIQDLSRETDFLSYFSPEQINQVLQIIISDPTFHEWYKV